MKLTEEQLNFLTRINLEGPRHYSIFGDRVGDEEAKIQLREMASSGLLIFNEFDARITEKGKELIRDRTTFRL